MKPVRLGTGRPATDVWADRRADVRHSAERSRRAMLDLLRSEGMPAEAASRIAAEAAENQFSTTEKPAPLTVTGGRARFRVRYDWEQPSDGITIDTRGNKP